MATICRNHKLLFIMVPGTGCSSVGKILREKFEGEYIPKEDIYKNNSRILDRKHNSINDLVKFSLINRVELAIYLKFGTVRNPFDYFATEYQRAISDKWIDSLIIRQTKDLSPDSEEQGKLFIQKLETKLKHNQNKVKNMGFETSSSISFHSTGQGIRRSLSPDFCPTPPYLYP